MLNTYIEIWEIYSLSQWYLIVQRIFLILQIYPIYNIILYIYSGLLNNSYKLKYIIIWDQSVDKTNKHINYRWTYHI